MRRLHFTYVVDGSVHVDGGDDHMSLTLTPEEAGAAAAIQLSSQMETIAELLRDVLIELRGRD